MKGLRALPHTCKVPNSVFKIMHDFPLTRTLSMPLFYLRLICSGHSSWVCSAAQLNPTLRDRITSPPAPLSTGFSRQGYWSGLPFPSAGDLSDPEIELTSPALAGGSFTTQPPGNPGQ